MSTDYKPSRLIPAVTVPEGAGVTVQRSIGSPALRNYDPFMLLDYFSSDNPDDYIAGFPDHPHRGFNTFTYMLDGHMQHRDSMGNGAIIQAGDLQYMSAGSGIQHSEFNPSDADKTHLYQIWLTPNVRDGEPRYAEKPLGRDAAPNQLHLLFSGSGRDGSTAIRQQAEISFAKADAALLVTYNDERSETEVLTALCCLGYPVDGDQTVGKLGCLLFTIAATAAVFTFCHRWHPFCQWAVARCPIPVTKDGPGSSKPGRTPACAEFRFSDHLHGQLRPEP